MDGSGRWSVDHLFVTRRAVPVLVELKRASDTRIRREVVGQMLDYAANATAYWKAGRVADAFAATAIDAGCDPDVALAEFLGDVDPVGFWEQVDSNFAAGRLKLVFVADQIPRELARVVEFLNDQMRADVRAVELRWFAGEGGMRTLSPRIIGETQRAAAAKSTGGSQCLLLDREAWVAQKLAPLGDDRVAAARRFISIMEGVGGQVEVSTAQASLIGSIIVPGDKPLYVLAAYPQSKGVVSLTLRWLKTRPAFASESSRQVLYDEAKSIFGQLSSSNLGGYPSAPLTMLNDERVGARLSELLLTIARTASGPTLAQVGVAG